MKRIVIDSSYFTVRIRYKWKVGGGKVFYVDTLETMHIINIMSLLQDRKRKFPIVYMGRHKDEWNRIMREELIKRGITKFPSRFASFSSY